MTHPAPRNIGRRNTHNTNPIVEPIMIATHLATFFIWLNPEVDVKPRPADMLLFVFIVWHFFICISPSVSVCSTPKGRVWIKRNVRRQRENTSAKWVLAGIYGGKYHFVSGDFPDDGIRMFLSHTFISASKLKTWSWYCNETGNKTPLRWKRTTT